MQFDSLVSTFTHENIPQYSLTCTLNSSNNEHYLNMLLHVPTDTFPKIYQKQLNNQSLSFELKLIFENVVNLYKVIKEKKNIQISVNGRLKIKYGIVMGSMEEQNIETANQGKCRSIEIILQRSLQNELDEIRAIISQQTQGIGDSEHLQNRIQKLWRRQEENEKIFMKFKEDIDFRIQEFSERMAIQNTKISIIREDINKLLLSFNKLSNILCPVFAKINILSEFTNQFILQDRKIMYIGESSQWTQISFKQQLNWHRKYQISFKVVNSKRCNIIAGITLASQFIYRSSLVTNKGEKGDRKYIGLSGLGHLYSSSQQQPFEQKNLSKHESQKSSEGQKQTYNQSQKKIGHEITMSSPVMTSLKSPGLHSHHSLMTSSKHSAQSAAVFKPMQIIKMMIQPEKERIWWKNGSKVLAETKIGTQFKNQNIVIYFQLCDTGDSIQLIDI